ncbi:MAG TPA: hypothetical protein VNM22_09710 [Candidatus Limnocylindrales bacterium]|nr:hypothetical protein [Candidatus Limnocylindrales bacterium]
MSMQSQEHKNKMKVSNPLNDLAANLGVTLKVLIQLAMGPDREFREMVRMLLSALPEHEVVMIAEDPEIDAQFLDYLSRIFETSTAVQQALLKNPSVSATTLEHIAKLLPGSIIEAIAADPNVRPELLERFVKIFGSSQVNLMKLIAQNPATPAPLREQLARDLLKRVGAEKSVETASQKVGEASVADSIKQIPSEPTLSDCVGQLLEINFNIVSDFMKRINEQIIKQLERLAEANKQILQVISKNADSLDPRTLRLTPELVAFVMRRLPALVPEQEILKFLQDQQADQKKTAEVEEPVEEREEENLSLQDQIKKMNVGQRIQLARKGGIAERRILIRDTDRDVALTVLENPKITESEIEVIAGMREVSEDVLRAIAARKEWVNNYNILVRLIKNPKTPVDISLNYLNRLNKKDLDFLQKSRAIPQVVRNASRQILLQRIQSRK